MLRPSALRKGRVARSPFPSLPAARPSCFFTAHGRANGLGRGWRALRFGEYSGNMAERVGPACKQYAGNAALFPTYRGFKPTKMGRRIRPSKKQQNCFLRSVARRNGSGSLRNCRPFRHGKRRFRGRIPNSDRFFAFLWLLPWERCAPFLLGRFLTVYRKNRHAVSTLQRTWFRACIRQVWRLFPVAFDETEAKYERMPPQSPRP